MVLYTDRHMGACCDERFRNPLDYILGHTLLLLGRGSSMGHIPVLALFGIAGDDVTLQF